MLSVNGNNTHMNDKLVEFGDDSSTVSETYFILF